jgi:peptidoglycan DL-endopeptidase LytE
MEYSLSLPEPQFGWIPSKSPYRPHELRKRGTQPSRAARAEVPGTTPSEGDRFRGYWVPYRAGAYPPTIIKRPKAGRTLPVIEWTRQPALLALAAAALGTSGLFGAAGTSASPASLLDTTRSPGPALTLASDQSVPADVAAPAPEPTSDSEAELTPQSTIYTVVAGDTLRDIAARYGLDTLALALANNLANPDLIYPGDQLVIPATGAISDAPLVQELITVVVQPGDTIRDIAARHGVLMSAIIDYAPNNLANPDLIFPEQVLTIPGAVSSTVTELRNVASPPVQPAAPVSTIGQHIVDLGMNYLGYPFVWGAIGPDRFDCSGFTYFIVNQAGFSLARDMATQVVTGIPVAPEDLQPGDLVFQQNTYQAGLSHTGIYIGNGKFLNAASERVGVVVSDLWDDYWGPRFHSARRIVE